MNDIDLHIHTIYSDGTDDCSAILSKIRAQKVKIFSVTDHDNIDSVAHLQKLDLSGLQYIVGVELSCIFNELDIHLLAYDFDINNLSMQNLLQTAKQNRLIKIKKILDYLQQIHGIALSDSDIVSLYSASGSVGKPHFASILLKMGFGDNISGIISKYMSDFSTPELKINVLDAITAVKQSGGISVAAHPIRIINQLHCSYNGVSKIITQLKNMGLDGLEVFYSRHTATDISNFTAIAQKLNLLITCGSDYHGYNKPGKQIGVVSSNANVDYDLVQPFLQRVAKR